MSPRTLHRGARIQLRALRAPRWSRGSDLTAFGQPALPLGSNLRFSSGRYSKKGPRPQMSPRTLHRGARIRTGDPLLPKQVRYRTAPRPVSRGSSATITARKVAASAVNDQNVWAAPPMRQRIRPDLEVHHDRLRSFASLLKPRRAIAFGHPQSAALPTGVRIVDPRRRPGRAGRRFARRTRIGDDGWSSTYRRTCTLPSTGRGRPGAVRTGPSDTARPTDGRIRSCGSPDCPGLGPAR